MTVLVTGAGGMLGRRVVDVLTRRGIAARGSGRGPAPPWSRGEWRRADLVSGEGLADAVAGVSAVVHCATDPRRPENDLRCMDNLTEVMRGDGGLIVHVGVAGIEDAAAVLPYYRAKLECERRLRDAGVPHTICRATQFHPFVERRLAGLGWGPVQLSPRLRLQPVDPGHVAARLVDLCSDPPRGRTPDVCGPETLSTTELVRPWLLSRNLRRVLLPLPQVGVLSSWNRLRPAEGPPGGIGWSDWLEGGAHATG